APAGEPRAGRRGDLEPDEVAAVEGVRARASAGDLALVGPHRARARPRLDHRQRELDDGVAVAALAHGAVGGDLVAHRVDAALAASAAARAVAAERRVLDARGARRIDGAGLGVGPARAVAAVAAVTALPADRAGRRRAAVASAPTGGAPVAADSSEAARLAV